MIIALELLDKSEKRMLEKYENILSVWMTDEMHEAYRQAIKIHLPDNNWRVVE
jgi:isopentenyl-diphosphate delta-isomerase